MKKRIHLCGFHLCSHFTYGLCYLFIYNIFEEMQHLVFISGKEPISV